MSDEPGTSDDKTASVIRDVADNILEDPIEEPLDGLGATDDPPRKSFTAELRETAEQVLDKQRQRAADSVKSVAETLHQTADQLDEQRIGPIADYARRAAVEVDSFAETVRARSLDDLMNDATALVRQRPGLFLAGAAGVGFLLGRFLRASEARHSATVTESL
jgi:ElaB/YqjD/DUF883 family membrane-anchored ribosome-binding protein